MNSISRRYRKLSIKVQATSALVIMLVILLNYKISTISVIKVNTVDGVTKMEAVRKYADYTNLINILTILSILLISIIAISILNRAIIRLGKDFENFSKQIGDSDTNQLLEEQQYIEFNQIANALNIRKHRIDSIIKKRDDYFNMMIHDFKAPLQILSANIEMSELEPDNQLYMEMIKEEVEVLDYEINRILKLEKINYFEEVNATEGNIVELVSSIVNKFNVNRNAVSLNIASNQIIQIFDSEMVHKVLINLIQNGLKYSVDESVQIELTEHQILISNPVSTDVIETDIFSVKERIKSQNGNGLGSQIVAKYIELLGWEISSSVRDSNFNVVIKMNDN